MVKISFQAVSGQKVEKESDGDKTEILIPHPMVSKRVACSHLTHYNRAWYQLLCVDGLYVTRCLLCVQQAHLPAWSAGQPAPARSWAAAGGFFPLFFDSIYRHLVGNKTCHCCDAFLCASALCARLMQVIPMCKNACSLIRAALGGLSPPQNKKPQCTNLKALYLVYLSSSPAVLMYSMKTNPPSFQKKG